MNLQRLTALARELGAGKVTLDVRQEETRVVATIFVDRTQIASATGEEEQAARSKLEEALVLAVREAQQRSLSNESVAAFARRARLLGDLA